MSNPAQLLEEDRVGRQRALELESFIVEAPAGSGKTELLIQRYLRLLAVVVDPEEIVAITFTNKAAAEMRNRILESLASAGGGDAPPEPHKRITFDLAQAALHAGVARGWQLVEQPARLRILTIDALCASLARQMPFLSRFGAQPRISDDPQQHYDEAARRTVALLDETGAVGDVVAEALRHLDNNTAHLARLLASMLARRDQWLRHAMAPAEGRGTYARDICEEAERGLRALVQRDLEQAAAGVSPRLQGLLMPAARYAAAHCPNPATLAALAEWTTALPVTAAALPQWRALCDLLLTKENTARKQYNKNNGLPAGKESEPFKKLLLDCLAELSAQDVACLARIRKLPDPQYSQEEWRTVEVLAQLLKLAAVQLWSVFHEQGEADFVEVAQRALLALGDEEAPSDLALQLDYRIQHLLVDEFQDTSPTQIQLLQRLTAGWMPDDGRTLFAVGDPMQSIYRFRKADVGLFLRAADTGIGNIRLQRLRLWRNNRSCEPLVDWVNRSFATVFPAQDSVSAGAIRYRSSIATRAAPAAAESGVFIHPLIVARETPGELADLREAERILAIVQRERALHPNRRIAVLVRARSHLDALVAQIRHHQPGLRFQAVEIERLAACQTVQDLLALTRALLHRADRVNWLAVLRAPWCGLTLADLHALAADDHAATVWQLMNDPARVQRLSLDGQRRLQHVRAVLAEAYAHQCRARLRRWVEGVWLKIGGAACLRQAAEMIDVQAYFDLLDSLDAAGRFRLDRLEQEVVALYAAPDALADGSLQFMTIHKSKGLEFDVVVLPGLHRKVGGDDHELMLWEEVAIDGLDECLVAAPLRRHKRNDDALPTPYDFLRMLEQQCAANEDARVLYVAVTRAICSLHLVGVARADEEGEPALPAGSYLDLLRASLLGDFADAVARQGPGGDDNMLAGGMAGKAFIPRLVRVVAPLVPEVLQQSACAASEAAAAVSAGPGAILTHADDAEDVCLDPLAASIGTLVHAYLEMIARSGVEDWSGGRLRSLQPAMAHWFVQHGHAAADAKHGAARVVAALQATLASPAGRWVLLPRPGGVTELAVAHVGPGYDGLTGLTSHVVDRSFIEDGQRWIIDYKTVEVDSDNDAVLSAHAERYRDQLERYARLFADEDLPLRLGVFYVAHGRLVELPALPAMYMPNQDSSNGE
ncbi:MAG: UvrD-helicase domain-containing protein [Sterolibacterium sp.]